MAKVRKKLILSSLLVCGIVVLLVVSTWEGLVIRRYTLNSKKLTNPVRLLVLTDLHSTMYGKNQSILLAKIRELKPDLVLLVGDIVDDKRPMEGALQLLQALGSEYPCFYVTGNHEFWSGKAYEIKDSIRSFGITVLEGNCKTVEVQGQRIQICGVDDPDGFEEESFFRTEISPGWDQELEKCEAQLDAGAYSILLSHRPERVQYYAQIGFDLVVAGHAHGGQIRIPGLLNGLYAPNQGLFPKYGGGSYDLGGSTMIVSRGLSKSILPRVFNPPEIVVVDLEAGV
ncbi:MAG TPA: metallophosphoesterase [Coprothermobacter sp.]|nr:metallophosphoesterase [Coprothermobacter sp.]